MQQLEWISKFQSDTNSSDRWIKVRAEKTTGKDLGVECGDVRIKNKKFKKSGCYKTASI